MGIQINGQTDVISAADGSLTVSGADLTSAINFNVSGVGTITDLRATNANITGVGTIATLIVTGNASIGGTVTYMDVTNVDSVGIITAQVGLQVLANGIDVTGISTLREVSVSGGINASQGIDAAGLRVTGIATHEQTTTTGLSNAGVSTLGDARASTLVMSGFSTFSGGASANLFRTAGITSLSDSTAVTLTVSGVSTLSGGVNAPQGINIATNGLKVAGITTLEQTNITGLSNAGVSTLGNATASTLNVTGFTTTNATSATFLNVSGVTTITTVKVGTAVTIDSSGVQVGAGRSIKLFGSTSGFISIGASAVAGISTLTLPVGVGSSGQILGTNGSGVLSFVGGRILNVFFEVDGTNYTRTSTTSAIFGASFTYTPVSATSHFLCWGTSTTEADQSGGDNDALVLLTYANQLANGSYNDWNTGTNNVGGLNVATNFEVRGQVTVFQEFSDRNSAGNVVIRNYGSAEADGTAGQVTTMTVFNSSILLIEYEP